MIQTKTFTSKKDQVNKELDEFMKEMLENKWKLISHTGAETDGVYNDLIVYDDNE
jgi:hypothetical protein